LGVLFVKKNCRWGNTRGKNAVGTASNFLVPRGEVGVGRNPTTKKPGQILHTIHKGIGLKLGWQLEKKTLDLKKHRGNE